jgi:hypothetical protein
MAPLIGLSSNFYWPQRMVSSRTVARKSDEPVTGNRQQPDASGVIRRVGHGVVVEREANQGASGSVASRTAI